MATRMAYFLGNFLNILEVLFYYIFLFQNQRLSINSNNLIFTRMLQKRPICWWIWWNWFRFQVATSSIPNLKITSEFSRGNPMHLNDEHYSRIRRLWLHQEIAEEVINQYEINQRNSLYSWSQFWKKYIFVRSLIVMISVLKSISVVFLIIFNIQNFQ